LFGTGATKTNALEALVIAGFVRGLSTRDVEAALAEALGEQAGGVALDGLADLRADQRAVPGVMSPPPRRGEAGLPVLDGSHFKYHANAAAEPVLAAWGIDTDGKPVFVGLNAAASESGDAWEGFLTDLGERGLEGPLLVISDGALGLIGAVERTMGAALCQRCLIARAPSTYASHASTGRASATPTSSNAPSARAAAARRSSVGDHGAEFT
jgi:putative transposase